MAAVPYIVSLLLDCVAVGPSEEHLRISLEKWVVEFALDMLPGS